MKNALKTSGKDDPMNDPELAVEKAALAAPDESKVASPKEIAKA